jgi:hypothetical protein
MLIANQKRKENVAEYLIYMFQIEDLIRAYSFNIELIDQNIINKFNQPYSIKRDMREWYSSLIYIMQSKNLKEKGHTPFIQSLIEELEKFNNSLLQKSDEHRYRNAYSKVKSSIQALRVRSNNDKHGDIELCLNGLYGLLMLKLKKQNISPETAEAFELISEFIAILSAKFLQYEILQSKN